MIPEFNKVNLPKNTEQAAQVTAASFQKQYPKLSAIENGFRAQVEGTDFKDDVEKGVALLKAAGAKDSDEPKAYDPLDFDIQRLSAAIKKERAKTNPNRTVLDSLIKELAYYLLAKLGFEDREISQEEVDRLYEDIEKVVGTYNTKWSLAANIASGACSILGGLVGIGANAEGIFKVFGATAKTVKSWADIGSGVGSVGQGIGTFSKPIDSANDSERRLAEFETQRTQGREDAAKTSYRKWDQLSQQTLNNVKSAADTRYSAVRGILSAGAA